MRPALGDFIISQGDSLPIMRIPIPANSAGQFPDPVANHVTFLGRIAGERKPGPPPFVVPMQSHAMETHDFGAGPVQVRAIYVKLTSASTAAIPTGKADYVQMEGELEFRSKSNPSECLTIPNHPLFPTYLKWWIRDDIGDGA